MSVPQMDEESDEELAELSELYAQEGAEGSTADGTHRFALLRELWASACWRCVLARTRDQGPLPGNAGRERIGWQSRNTSPSGGACIGACRFQAARLHGQQGSLRIHTSRSASPSIIHVRHKLEQTECAFDEVAFIQLPQALVHT